MKDEEEAEDDGFKDWDKKPSKHNCGTLEENTDDEGNINP